ncbi:MAG: 3'-5' exoribonuclease YhaM family protein [Acidobacteriota bacterium]
MARMFVSEIQPNQEVSGTFVLAEKQLKTARNNMPFLTLKLVDRTGAITGRVWDRAVDISNSLVTGGPVCLRGRCETYREEMQLQVQEISSVAVSDVDPRDFLPVCPIASETLIEEFKKIVLGIGNGPLCQLLTHIFRDREIWDRFKLAPAAKSMHHAYLGGLLEHTVAVAKLATSIAERYPDLDRDILVTGAVLHDIGKIYEFDYSLCIDYSDSGRLIGHTVMGMQLLEEKIRTLQDVSIEEEGIILKHMILSHHGTAEFGAVKLPMTREALVLHMADDMDAKINCLTRIMGEGEDAWTPYQKLFDRYFFRGFPASKDVCTAPTEDFE